jgi:hypothetical protein
VIIKKRKEKEFRTLWFGSNPHSKVLFFSRLSFVLKDLIREDNTIIKEIIIVIVVAQIRRIKILNVKLSNWKLDILVYISILERSSIDESKEK